MVHLISLPWTQQPRGSSLREVHGISVFLLSVLSPPVCILFSEKSTPPPQIESDLCVTHCTSNFLCFSKPVSERFSKIQERLLS